MHAKVTQHSFIPDNDRERVMPRPPVPVCKCIAGRWCWLKFGTQEYVWEPELEKILLSVAAAERAA